MPPLVLTIAVLALAPLPLRAQECSTVELKTDAVEDFIDEHYASGFSMIYSLEGETDMFEVEFWPYYPPEHRLRQGGEEWPVQCTGTMRVSDGCAVSDATIECSS